MASAKRMAELEASLEELRRSNLELRVALKQAQAEVAELRTHLDWRDGRL